MEAGVLDYSLALARLGCLDHFILLDVILLLQVTQT